MNDPERGHYNNEQDYWSAVRRANEMKSVDDALERAHHQVLRDQQEMMDSIGNSNYAAHRAPREPATFYGTVQAWAIAGAILSALYAYWWLGITSWIVWGIQGLIGGGIVGAMAYSVIVLWRTLLPIIRWIVQIAFWVALILWVNHLIST